VAYPVTEKLSLLMSGQLIGKPIGHTMPENGFKRPGKLPKAVG
jgi:hypothetical protein